MTTATAESLQSSLIYHYVWAARRIAAAASGELSINHAANGAPPSADPSLVVGGCGYRGCHPYFSVSANALWQAIDQIQALEPALAVGREPTIAVDQLRGICFQLRQATTFSFQPDCGHASLPELGSLLPPQVIWWNGRQLPIDVWRLIAFDNDLISSGIAAGVDIRDLRDGVSSYTALVFARLMNETRARTISFQVREQGFPTPLAGTISRTITIPLARLFLEAGVLLTPLSQPSQLAAWFPAVRYLEWISPTGGELAVRRAFDTATVDSRYKAIFSEEIAIGMMAVALYERMGAYAIFNTSEIVPPQYGERWDFVAAAVTGLGQTVIAAESKGRIGGVVRRTEREKAKRQAQVARRGASGPIPGLLEIAFCSTMRYDNQSRVRSHCLAIDPPPERPFAFDQLEDPVHRWRVAYSKALRFAGLEIAAHQILHGLPLDAVPPSHAEAVQHDAPVVHLRVIDSGSFVIHRRVFKLLQLGLTHETVPRLEEELRTLTTEGRGVFPDTNSFINGLGVGFLQRPISGDNQVP